MIRERVLKVVLVLVGLLFGAAVYPLLAMHLEEALRMMLSVYATLGIFLLLASRDPSANRSLIAFAAWSSFAHAAVMSTLGLEMPSERTGFLGGSAALVVIGAALLALRPSAKKPAEEAVGSGA